MRTKFNSRTNKIILTILLIAWVVTAFFLYRWENERRITDENTRYLLEVTEQTSDLINQSLKGTESMVKTVARMYGRTLKSEKVNVFDINSLVSVTMFDSYYFADADGILHGIGTEDVSVADRDYFQKGMQGQSGMEVLYESRATGTPVLNFYAPVYYQGKILGVLAAQYEEEYLQEMIEQKLFGETTKTMLLDENGKIIAHSADTTAQAGEDFFEQSEKNTKITDELLEEIKEQYGEKETISYTYYNNDGKTHACLIKLNDLGWYVFQTVPTAVTSNMEQNANSAGAVLVVAVLVGFGIYLVIILMMELQHRKELAEENKVLTTILSETKMYKEMSNLQGCGMLAFTYPGGELVFANDATREMLGWETKEDQEDFLNGKMRDISFTDKKVKEKLTHLDTVGESVAYEFYITHKDGKRIKIYGIKKLIHLEAVGDLMITSYMNVTESETLRLAAKKAEEASKAKTDFLSSMSHDIRTPMNAIIGMTKIAKNHMDDRRKLEDCLTQIENSGIRLHTLVNDILDLSAIENGKVIFHRQSVKLTDFVDSVVAQLQFLMKCKEIQFTCNVHDILHEYLHIDEVRAGQIYTNLLSNAVKYSNRGGEVLFEVWQEPLPEDSKESLTVQSSKASSEALTSLSAERPQEAARSSADASTASLANGQADLTYAPSNKIRLCAKIQDCGIGMSKKFMKTMFQSFTREVDTRVNRTEGSGLGLAIVKQLTELVGGEIDVQSEEGRGTTFLVKIDVEYALEAPKTECAPQDATLSAEQFAGIRILAAEDNDLNYRILEEFLTGYGMEVERAENGVESVDKFIHSDDYYYTMILMDIQMPIMNGYMATDLIRTSGHPKARTIPIIAMTADAFSSDVEKCLRSGMQAHVAKPIDVDLMLRTILKYR